MSQTGMAIQKHQQGKHGKLLLCNPSKFANRQHSINMLGSVDFLGITNEVEAHATTLYTELINETVHSKEDFLLLVSPHIGGTSLHK